MPTILGINIIDVIVIVVYFAFVLYIGYRAMKKVKSSEDYFLGGRQFGRFFQTFSQFGQATSTESAVQSVSMVGSNGLAAAFGSMAKAIPFNPVTWLFPKWLRRSRMMSMADYFVERFQSKKLAALYAVALASLFILVGGAGLYAMSKTVCTIAEKPVTELSAAESVEYNKSLRLRQLEQSPAQLLTAAEVSEMSSLREASPREHYSYLNQRMLIVFMAIFIMLYAAGGGLEAAVYTDAMQSMFILVLTVLLIPFAMVKLNALHGTTGIVGPFSVIHRVLPQSLFEIAGSPNWVEFKWYNIILLALASIAGNIAFANNLVVSGAARTEKIASFGGMTGSMIKGVSSLFWMVLALFILGIFGEQSSDPDLLWGMAARTLLPTGLLGLMMACLLAALMSTADTHMMTVSGLLTQNLYKPLFPNRPDEHYVKVGRVLGAIYLIGAVFIAFNASNIFRMLKFMVFITIACRPAMLVGFLWRRANAKGVWLSMGASLVITLFIPMVASIPSIRENPNMLMEIQAAEVQKVYTASERDVQNRSKEIEKWNLLSSKNLAKGECPTELKVGDEFTKTYLPAKRAVFWDQNIKVRKDGTRYGDGLFKPELYAMHLCGFNFSNRSPSQVEAISISIRLIFPFLAVILVGLFTKPVPKDVLDRFYVKLRTPVNEDHDQDAIDVAENQKHPERTEHVLLFPNSNWEFQKQSRYDVIGMSIASSVAIVLTVAIYLIAKIGV
jgi:SSS family solute:Na+ symporter